MFKFLRYFSLASAAALIVVIVVLVALYRQNAFDDLVESASQQNTVLAHALANAIWPRFGSYLRSVSSTNREELLARRETDELRATVAELTAGLPVLKIKVYNTEGITVYSTEPKQIGEGYSNKLGFQAALTSGKPASVFSRHDKFSGFSGEIFNRDIVEIYFPIRADDGSVGAIIEIYSDETVLVKRVDRTATDLFVGLLIVFTGLYLALYAIVRRADTILKRQYAGLADSEETIRTQNAELMREVDEHKMTGRSLQAARNELEARIVERTNDLAAAKLQAERANEGKSKFLAAASHDLRQPHQTLVLYMSLLSKLLKEDEEREILALMRQSLQTIQGFLKSLLDVSKLEAKIVKPETTDFHLNELLSRVDVNFRPLAVEKGLEFRYVPTSHVVGTASDLLETIISNLVSNAVEHTAAGRVLVGCRRRGAYVRIEVWDTGPGIPEDQIEAIFHEYVQLDSAERERGLGMGLGLAIVERSARLLGCRIDIVSQPGKGSMFAIEVPMGDPERALTTSITPTITSADLSGTRILVIEDEATVLAALRRLLENSGCRVVASQSIGDALDLIAEKDFQPDLVLADYRLADGVTGDTAIRRVRRQVDSPIPGIIITGDTSPERLSDARRSHFTLLHKPVEPAELCLAIQDNLSGAA